MSKWKIGIIIGVIWGVISFYLWMMLSGGSISSANPPITFVILTLPASIPILIAYYKVIDFSGTLLVCLIPITGALIGAGTGCLVDKIKNPEPTDIHNS